MAPRARSFLALTAALAVLPAGRAAAMDARPASAFADAVGVNVHMSYGNTPYADVARASAALRDLGVRHVRDTLCAACTWERDAQAALAAQSGAKFDFIIGGPGPGGIADATADLAEAATARRAYTEALEAPNELDNGAADASWAPLARAQTQLVAAAARGAGPLHGLPVIGPSLVSSAGRSLLGDVSDGVDYANSHPYRIDRAPEDGLDAEDAAAEETAPGRPIIATEAGYRAGGDASGWNVPLDEATVAEYLPRVLLEGFRRGWARTYAYELIDTFPTDTTGPAADQSGYGLLRSDGTPRPAYVALRALMDLLGDTTAATSDAAPLDVELQDGPDDLRHVLLRRTDGSYVLALWQPTSAWDRAARRPIAEVPASVRVALPGGADVTVHRLTPSFTTTAVGTTTSTEIPVSGDVTLLELRPAPAATPSAPTVPAATSVAAAPVPTTTDATPVALPAVTAPAPVATPAPVASTPTVAQAAATVPTPSSSSAADATPTRTQAEGPAFAPGPEPRAAVAATSTTEATPDAVAPALAPASAVAPTTASTAARATTAGRSAPAPMATLSARVDGGWLRAGTAVRVPATRIAYLLDGRVAARRTGAPWGARWPLRALPAGRHRLTALVRLRTGALVRTRALTVTVRR